MIFLILFILNAFICALMFPSAIILPYLLIKNYNSWNHSLGNPVNGRNVIILITTKGEAQEVVANIIKTLKSYSINTRIIVLTEYYDLYRYDAEILRVPADYKTKNGSKNKQRALQYYSEWLLKNNIGSNTYTLHIDDDNIPDELYIKNVMAMPFDAGQGTIRLREYKNCIISTIANFQRVTFTDALLIYANKKFKPLSVGGEGLTIRADIEAKLGWDFGPIAAEDLLMGQRIHFEGYKYGYIPGKIYIAPALNLKDFYAQRGRWIHHFFVSRKGIFNMNPAAVILFSYLYDFMWVPFVGIILWFFDFYFKFHFPLIMLIILTYELIMGVLISFYGAFQHSCKLLKIYTLLLQIPLTFFVAIPVFYYLITRKKLGETDYTIKKV